MKGKDHLSVINIKFSAKFLKKKYKIQQKAKMKIFNFNIYLKLIQYIKKIK